MERDEPLSNQALDPIAAVMDWLGACAEGRLDDLLDMYEENASLECGCDGPYIYCGRAILGGYWSSRLADSAPQAFTLNNVLPGEDPNCVVLDCLSHEANLFESISGSRRPGRFPERFAARFKRAGQQCDYSVWTYAADGSPALAAA